MWEILFWLAALPLFCVALVVFWMMPDWYYLPIMVIVGYAVLICWLREKAFGSKREKEQ